MARNDRIVTLDIGAGSVKLACFVPSRAGGIEMVRFGVRPLPSESSDTDQRNEEVSAAVAELVREQGVAGLPVLVGVPGQSVFSRFVRLPPISRDKVLQIVANEAQLNVPFPINEVVWDYQLIGEGAAEMDVMIAAIKAEIVEGLTDAVASAGLQPEIVDVAPMALYNAVRYNYDELPRCTLAIDIGARATDLVFIEANRVFNRSIPVGGNTITQQLMKSFDLSFSDAEELKRQHAFVAFGGAYEAPQSEVADKVSKTVRSIMTRLHTEISRSINFYRTQQSGQAPGLALLTGGSSVIPHADAFLKEKLEIEVEPFNPFRNVAVAESVRREDLAEHGHLLSQSVGLALRRSGLACPIEINLIPPKVVEAQRFLKKQPFFVLSAVLLVFTLAVWAVFFHKLSSLGRERLDNLRRTVSSLEEVDAELRRHERRVDEMLARGQSLEELARARTAYLETLNEVHGRLPPGMWLTFVSPDLPGSPGSGPEGEPAEAGSIAPVTVSSLRLRGVGYLDKATQEGAIRFRDRLRESPRFTAETEVVEAPRPLPDDFVFQFTIQVVLKEPIRL